MHPFSGSALFSLKKIAGSFTFIVFCVMSVVFVFGYLLSVLCNAFLCCGFKCGFRGGTGSPDPPGKSQVIWVSTGNKQLDPPPPLEKIGPPWTLSGTLKMIVFFGINYLTSVK